MKDIENQEQKVLEQLDEEETFRDRLDRIESHLVNEIEGIKDNINQNLKEIVEDHIKNSVSGGDILEMISSGLDENTFEKLESLEKSQINLEKKLARLARKVSHR